MYFIWGFLVLFGAYLGVFQLLGYTDGDAGQTLQSMLLALILAKMSKEES